MSSFTESPKRSSHDDTVLAAAGGGCMTTCSEAKLVVSRPLFAAELAEVAFVWTETLIAELAEGASVWIVWIGALIAEPRSFLCFSASVCLSANKSVVPVGANDWPMTEESLKQVTFEIN
jgi:hypothetical protein